MLECKRRLVNRRRCRKEESQASKCGEVTCEWPPTEYVNGVVIMNTSIEVFVLEFARA
jgi:hypothetical protein